MEDIRKRIEFLSVPIQIQKSRFPLCTVNAQKQGISGWTWKSVFPISIELDDVEYDIKDWLGLGLSHPNYDGPVAVEVKENIAKILKPLESLCFNTTTQSWTYKEDCVLSIDKQTITQGFVSDFSKSRGRGMLFCLLSQLFSSSTTMKPVKIGGGAAVNEPSVRELMFKITFEPSESNSSPSDSPTKLPLESSPIRTSPRTCVKKPLLENTDYTISQSFKFVPDIVLESAKEEHLLVEIKKGKVLYPESLSQLRYMLMPAAIKQGTALGLLICTNKAVLVKCIAVTNELNNEVKFERSFFELGKDSLVADMEKLLTHIYYEIVQ